MGADTGNVLVSVSGVAVLLTAGVLSFPYLRTPGLQSDADKKPWKGRIRNILLTGVFSCALAALLLLLYGVENRDLGITGLGLLVLWLGVALWIPTLYIPRPRFHYPSTYNPDAVRVSISDLSDTRNMWLEWAEDRPGLWIGVYQWNHVSELDTRLVLALTPEDHMVFLAITAEENYVEQIALKDMLNGSGDHYLEEVERHGRQNWQTIFASTRNENVLTHIFTRFGYYYQSLESYPFIIAKGELSAWVDSLRRVLRMGLTGVTRDMIENSLCVMVTDWEHGMEMLTNKVSEESVLKVAAELANEWSLPLIKEIQ